MASDVVGAFVLKAESFWEGWILDESQQTLRLCYPPLVAPFSIGVVLPLPSHHCFHTWSVSSEHSCAERGNPISAAWMPNQYNIYIYIIVGNLTSCWFMDTPFLQYSSTGFAIVRRWTRKRGQLLCSEPCRWGFKSASFQAMILWATFLLASQWFDRDQCEIWWFAWVRPRRSLKSSPGWPQVGGIWGIWGVLWPLGSTQKWRPSKWIQMENCRFSLFVSCQDGVAWSFVTHMWKLVITSLEKLGGNMITFLLAQIVRWWRPWTGGWQGSQACSRGIQPK